MQIIFMLLFLETKVPSVEVVGRFCVVVQMTIFSYITLTMVLQDYLVSNFVLMKIVCNMSFFLFPIEMF